MTRRETVTEQEDRRQCCRCHVLLNPGEGEWRHILTCMQSRASFQWICRDEIACRKRRRQEPDPVQEILALLSALHLTQEEADRIKQRAQERVRR